VIQQTENILFVLSGSKDQNIQDFSPTTRGGYHFLTQTLGAVLVTGPTRNKPESIQQTRLLIFEAQPISRLIWSFEITRTDLMEGVQILTYHQQGEENEVASYLVESSNKKEIGKAF
jgi:hypothetical protein